MSLGKGIGNGIGMKRSLASAAPPPEARSQAESMPAVEVKDPLRRGVWQTLKDLFSKVRNFIVGNAFEIFLLISFPILLAVSTLHTFYILI